jgi:predicted AAA+ superfamily ATPase
VYANLRKNPLLKTFRRLLVDLSAEAEVKAEDGDGQGVLSRWPAFIRALIGVAPDRAASPAGGFFFSAVRFLTLTDDNPFTQAAEHLAPDGQNRLLFTAARNDLARLGRIASVDIGGLGRRVAALLRSGGLPEAALQVEAEADALESGRREGDHPTGTAAVQGTPAIFLPDGDWAADLPAFTAHLRVEGSGLLGLHRSFRWASGHPQPVLNPDPVRLADLSGYGDQRSLVIANTLRFLAGKPANNLLLYGDRGTGKSATVKAVCGEYASQGLRLLEVPKENLGELPAILEFTASRGLNFVLFIDDLSFEAMDDSFTALKALLEGGTESRPANTVIYATSNRRHLVKERHADRPGPGAGISADGEVRGFDTMQEQLSLSDRFGLTVIYAAPNQEEYLDIACFIAEKRGILPLAAETRKQFRENALRWEKWFNGRSPRTAAQFVDWAAGGGGFPWETEGLT